MPERVSVKTTDLVAILSAKTSAIAHKSRHLNADFQEQNTIQSFNEFRELEEAFDEAFASVLRAYKLLSRRTS